MWSRRLLRLCKGSCRIYGVQNTPRLLVKSNARGQHAESRVNRDASGDASTEPFDIANGLRSFDTRNANASSHVQGAFMEKVLDSPCAPEIPSSGYSEAHESAVPRGPAEKLLHYNNTGLRIIEGVSSPVVKFSFSNETRAKIGKLRTHQSAGVTLADESDESTHGNIIRTTGLVKLLDQAIQSSTARGLGCLALATDSLKTDLVPGSMLTVFTPFQMNRHGPKVTTMVKADGTPTEIRLFGIGYKNISTTLENVVVNIPTMKVAILARHSTIESVALSFDAKDDIWYISANARMVISRVTGAMSFQGGEDMLKTVAETLLRILEFRTPFLEIQGITVKTFDTIILEAKARWASTDESSRDPLTRKVDVTCQNPAAEYDATETMLESDDGREREKEEAAEALREMLPDDESSIELIHLHRTSKHLQYYSPLIRPGNSLYKDARAKYKFRVIWPANCTSEVRRLTHRQVLQIATPAVSEVVSTLTDLKRAAKSIKDSLPGTLTISLHHTPGRAKATLAAGEWLTRSVVAKSPCSSHPYWAFLLKTYPKKVETTRCEEAASGAQVNVSLRFSAGVGLNASPSSHLSTASSYAEVLTAIGSQLISTISRQCRSATLYELASECVITSFASQPLAGIVNLNSLKVYLELDDNGGTSSTKRSSVATGRNGGHAFIALGSNMGDRVKHIEAACDLMNEDPDLQVERTSPLYETQPMYYENQGTFVNGVCRISTSLDPLELLDRLQSFENALGRMKLIDKGPRNIDLDILAYDGTQLHTERLIIPHNLMLEREFVLRPFRDIGSGYLHEATRRTISQHLHDLVANDDHTMFPITPLAPESEPLRSRRPDRRTRVMSILNMTPDSFSDGGVNRSTDLNALSQTILSHVASGATIIDIGGQSSRPGAPDITAEEEIARIIPAIEVIKTLPEAKHVSISIDTYRASVAEAAVKAGAHIINDISAGRLDPDMLSTIARLGCTYVMMHMRGTPATMQDPENTSYSKGIIPMIADELLKRTDAARDAGIKRWRIILDPGIGFAKTVEQNAELLGRFAELRNHDKLKTYPWLVGSSRKGFIGELTGVEDAKDRIDGTAATVTAAVAGGAEIVRVHDVKEMARVVRMADAMYRKSPSPSSKEVRDKDRGEEKNDE